MVAVDDAGAPLELPPLTPTSELGRQRFQAAERRRELRRETERRESEIQRGTENVPLVDRRADSEVEAN